MKRIYAKSVLYAYSDIDDHKRFLDELAEKAALDSMYDTTPAFLQCEEILKFAFQKEVLSELKSKIERVIAKFDGYERDCLDYKYFKIKPKEYYEDFDYTGRNYFRDQLRILQRFCERADKVGLTDEWFEENCLTAEYFREYLEYAEETERNSFKHKGKIHS